MDFNSKLVIFSGPSGVGKTTIAKHLLSKYDNFAFSISACTREKRTGEVDGKDYYFFSKEAFERKIQENELVEWEQVYSGLYYGTLKSEIARLASEHKHIIFDVDVKGGINIKKEYGDDALAILIKPPSLDALKKRLTERGTESEEMVASRLARAELELSYEDQFDKVLINNDLDETKVVVEEILSKFIPLN